MCINYEYKKSKPIDETNIYKELKKIYNKKEVLEAMLSILGSALTGQAIRGSYLLFLIGDASAGKSTLLDMAKYSFGCYVKQIKPDTFVEGKTQDKIVNTYFKGSYIRISWINEPKDKPFDIPFLKAWADGECNSERLYEEGSHDFKHYSLTIFTSNTMPRLKLDGGVARRIRALRHNSKFTPNIKDVDEKNNVYYANDDFKNNFENSIEMKLAFFNLIADYAHKWLSKSKKIILPEDFTETTNDILESNDTIGDFIDGYIDITHNRNDKLGKNKMLELITKAYPTKRFEVTQLVGQLKRKGLTYERQTRYKGIQGSFIGVRYKNEVAQEEQEESDLSIDQQIESLENQKYGIEQSILKLKQQLPNKQEYSDKCINTNVIVINEKTESKIKMLEDFIIIQNVINRDQKARYTMDLKFNKIIREYDNVNKLPKKEVDNYVDLEHKTTIPIEPKESVSIHEFCDGFDIEEPIKTPVKPKQKKPILSKEEKKKLRECESDTLTNDKDVEDYRKKITNLLVL